MKTAEEWANELGFIVDYSEDEKPDEYRISPEEIKQIQLDAWKQGMNTSKNIGIEYIEGEENIEYFIDAWQTRIRKGPIEWYNDENSTTKIE